MLILVALLFVWLIGVGVNQMAPQYLSPSITSALSLVGDFGAGLCTVMVALACVAAVYLLPERWSTLRRAVTGKSANSNRAVVRQRGAELIATAARWEAAEHWLREAYGEGLSPAETERLQTLVGYGWQVTGAVEVKALRLERGEKSRLFTPAER